MRQNSIDGKRPRSRRRWSWVVLGCLACAVLLVGLAPRIASSGLVRHAVLTRLNARIAPAELSAADWSLRWFGPISITGLHFTHPGQGLDLQVEKLGASSGLAAIVPSAKLNAGTITVTKPTVVLRMPQPPPAAQNMPAGHTPPYARPLGAVKQPGGLPLADLAAKLVVQDGHVEVIGADGAPFVLEHLGLTAAITSLHDPVTLTFTTAVPYAGEAGQVSMNGTLPQPQYFLTGGTTTTERLTLDASRLDLRSLRTVLASLTGRPWIHGGLANGKIALDYRGQASLLLKTDLTIDGLSMEPPGKPPSPPGNVRVQADLSYAQGRLTIRQLDCVSPWLGINAEGLFDTTPDANGRRTGQIKAALDADLVALTRDFGSLLKLNDTFQVQRGKAHMQLALAGTSASVDAKLSLTTGNLGLRSGSEVFEMQPSPTMKLDFSWPYARPPEVRELLLELPFARISGKGRLDDAIIKANIDLAALSRDLRRMTTNCPTMQGAIDLDLTSRKEGGQMLAAILVTASNLAADLPAGQRLNLGSGRLTASAKAPLLDGTPSTELSDLVFTFESTAGTISGAADRFVPPSSNRPPLVAGGRLKMALDLEAAQRIAAPFLTQLPPETMLGGKATLELALAGSGESMDAKIALTTDRLTLRSGKELFEMQPSPAMKLDFSWPYVRPPEVRELLLELPFARISGKGRLDDATIKANIDLTALSRDFRRMTTNCPVMQGAIDLDLTSRRDGGQMLAAILVTASNLAADLPAGQRLTLGSGRLTASAKAPLLNGQPSLHLPGPANRPGATATMKASLDQFGFANASQSPFAEPHAEASITAALSADASRLTLEMLSLTTSLAAIEAKGSIADLQKQRMTDLSGTLALDFDKLNHLLRAQGLASLELAGRQARPFSINGPLSGQGQALLSQLQAGAALYLESAAAFGLAAGPADVGLALSNGTLRLNYAPGLNQGKLQLVTDIQAAADPMVLSLPPATRVLQNAQLTQAMLDQALVMVLPLLRGSSVLGGSMDLTMQNCRVPLGETLKRDTTFSAVLALQNVRLAPDGVLKTILQLAGLGGQELTIQQYELTAECKDGRVTPSPLLLSIAGNKIKLSGTVGLDGTLAYTVEAPLSKTLVGKEAAQYLDGVMINVPVAGTVKSPTIDRDAMNKEIKRLLMEAIKKSAADVVGGLLKNIKL